MTQTYLSAPVGALMRPTLRIDRGDSISLAVVRLRENGAGLIPVVDGDRVCGVVTELSLAHAMAEDHQPNDSVEEATVTCPTIHPYETGAEAFRRCLDGNEGTLVVTDDQGRVMGLIGASDFWPKLRSPIKPPNIGGMATPFGVYLTCGTAHAGPSMWALMGTGACMMSMTLVAAIAAEWVGDLAARHGMSDFWAGNLATALTLLLFLILMRLVPLSGTHGAEHMVVNAIERDNPLAPDVVRRMPRVHPRCGTNIAAAGSVFMGLFGWEWINIPSIRFLVAALATMLIWRPLGTFLQQFVTTKPPSDRQLEGGIRAGKDLLDRYATGHIVVPNAWNRLWYSGLLHVIAGATLAALILSGISALLGHPIPLV